MKLFLIVISFFCFSLTGAEAHHHHRHHHIKHPGWMVLKGHVSTPAPSGMVRVQTAANIPITVNSRVAEKFKGFIADIVAAGYKPSHIGCYASGGHVPNSRHYAGAACDFDQRGWGKTVGFMYHVAAIAAAHGLRDGCSFRHSDCGHIDDGKSLRRYAYHKRYHHYWG